MCVCGCERIGFVAGGWRSLRKNQRRCCQRDAQGAANADAARAPRSQTQESTVPGYLSRLSAASLSALLALLHPVQRWWCGCDSRWAVVVRCRPSLPSSRCLCVDLVSGGWSGRTLSSPLSPHRRQSASQRPPSPSSQTRPDQQQGRPPDRGRDQRIGRLPAA
jgi:hypothetical protein